jgi:hypothetical protein
MAGILNLHQLSPLLECVWSAAIGALLESGMLKGSFGTLLIPVILAMAGTAPAAGHEGHEGHDGATAQATAPKTDKAVVPDTTNGVDQVVSIDCTETNMAKGASMMMGMPEGEKKSMGMKEMGMAMERMEKKDMAGCKEHMNKGMRMSR